MQNLSRRQFIKLGACAAASTALPRMAWASLPAKKLTLYNLHTAETLRVTYFEDGYYVGSALRELNHFLRDFRTHDMHPMDASLYDQLHTLQTLVEKPGVPFHIISGYRSPKTNQMLREHSEGVASHSLHMEGRAMDVRLPGKDLAHLHSAALSMNAGGVGYYPASDFIHLDTGPVRHWG